MINIFFFFFCKNIRESIGNINSGQTKFLFIYLFIIIILLIEKVDKQSLCNGRITQSTNSKKE